MERIKGPPDLRKLLESRPLDWSQVIAARIALRLLPQMAVSIEQEGTNRSPQVMFRATLISWAARNYPAHSMHDAAFAAARATISAEAYASYAAADRADAATYGAGRAAADAAALTETVADAANDAARIAAYAARSFVGATEAHLWENLEADFDWLASRTDPKSAARALTRQRLWWHWDSTVDIKIVQWQALKQRLLAIDPGYVFWINWYARRIQGARAAFDIPGDKGREEDKWLLRQIAEAPNEDFWERGASYVNRQLAEWLEEARERAAKNLETPTHAKSENPDFQIPPEPGRRLYGFNQDGLLDRLPPSQQDQLRDSPNQRRSYQHFRDDLTELLAEGQKLGRKLQELLERALEDFPEDFGNAEADIIWRHIGKLRRAYRKHLAAPKSPEPDDHRLDPQIAIDLGGLLDGMNNFVLGDQGLLRRQEDAVDPQLRSDRKEEAKAAEPLAKATIASEGVVTRAVKQDIAQGTADLEAALPSADSGDPSADAEVDSINRERRNIIGGLLTGAKDTLKDARSGAAKEAGKQSLDFVTKNSQTIVDYVRKAFSQETAEAIIKWIGSLF